MDINTPKNYEARSFAGTVEVRASGDKGAKVRGLAVVFGKRSENLGGFREIIQEGALDETDMSDVRALFNHDSNFVLGRNVSKTLRLEITRDGLQYDIDMPDTQTIRDLVLEPIKRGDVDQSSFGFIIGQGNDEWHEDEEGVLIRTIKKIQRLFDVSPVTFPAYQDSTAGARSMSRYLEERDATLAIRDQEIAARTKRDVELERLDRRIKLPR